jgi:hypothetical protein
MIANVVKGFIWICYLLEAHGLTVYPSHFFFLSLFITMRIIPYLKHVKALLTGLKKYANSSTIVQKM